MALVGTFGDLGSLAALGTADSSGDIEGTSLPGTALLSSQWGTSTPPTPPDPPSRALRVSRARPPISPSLVASPPALPDGFPPPTVGGQTLFGVSLPSWLPKWAAITGLLVIGAFGVDYAARKGLFRKLMGGRRVVSNPKGGRRRGARVVEGDDEHEDDDELVEEAKKFRKDFHWGYKARKVKRRKVSPRPRVLTKLGELTEVTYKTHKKGEKARFFTHDFEKGKPTLAMDITNKKLHIVGGDYTVTADGITG